MGYDFSIQRHSNDEEDSLLPGELRARLDKFIAGMEQDDGSELDIADWQLVKQEAREYLLNMGARISMAEWIEAIDQTEGLRLSPDDHVAHNPRTGEKLTVKRRDGDVDFLDGKGSWDWGIRYFEGCGTLRGRDWVGTDPLVRAVCRLARRLKARVFGEEGEEYPLQFD